MKADNGGELTINFTSCLICEKVYLPGIFFSSQLSVISLTLLLLPVGVNWAVHASIFCKHWQPRVRHRKHLDSIILSTSMNKSKTMLGWP